jgi:hypothetical protein
MASEPVILSTWQLVQIVPKVGKPPKNTPYWKWILVNDHSEQVDPNVFTNVNIPIGTWIRTEVWKKDNFWNIKSDFVSKVPIYEVISAPKLAPPTPSPPAVVNVPIVQSTTSATPERPNWDLINQTKQQQIEKAQAERKAEHDEYIKITQQMIVQLAAVKEELSLLRSAISVLLVNVIPPTVEKPDKLEGK